MEGLKQKEIDALGKWYQSIDFGKYGKAEGVATNLDKKWKLIKSYLPFSLQGKKVLDLGCNAGYYIVCSSREGAELILGVEPHKVFYKQCGFTMHMFSILEELTSKSNISIVDKNALDLKFHIKYDITFAFNFFYWLTYSDEKGSIKNPEDEILKFLKRLSFYTEYLLIIGAEGVAKMRAKKGANDIGTSLERTLPFIQVYFDVLKKDIVRQNRKRLSNIILCRAKEH